ncbi:ATP-grasp domain-containing protein [Mesocricetibacter intestinalis]|uniref:ATP-grasp domain-containing protein n=1 Tax=Mesocricetibacter intestinalis TaxID=1521930 RepID=UPI00105DB61D|nr:RimK family alpha-L-glutamate ligase [Mesocricetibacter intestinalis]
MKFLMLCREPRLYSCRRLLDTARHCGHQMDILDPNRCLLKLSQNPPHFEVYYQTERGRSPYLLSGYDALIPRFGSASTYTGCALLRHFAAQGSLCLNDETAFLNARDKWRSLQLLAQAGLPVPSSLFAGSEYESKVAVRQTKSPLVLKTLKGSQGIGVILAEKPQSAVSMLETLGQANVPVLLQEFIAEAGSADLRCFVIGDRVVAAMRRQGGEEEFRANCHRGGRGEKVLLNEQQTRIAVAASRALGLDVAGVDLILSANGPLVLEVNASPGLEMIEKTSGIDIALQMIVYLEKKIAASVKMT